MLVRANAAEMLGYLGCWSRGPYLALTVAEGRGPHNITITVTNKRGNLKDGDLFSQGAMRAKAASLASGSLLDPSPEATWEASPEYGQLSVIGRCHQKSPRLEAPEMHENSTELPYLMLPGPPCYTRHGITEVVEVVD